MGMFCSVLSKTPRIAAARDVLRERLGKQARISGILLEYLYSKLDSRAPRVARLAAASTTSTTNCGGGVAYHWLPKRGTNTRAPPGCASSRDAIGCTPTRDGLLTAEVAGRSYTRASSSVEMSLVPSCGEYLRFPCPSTPHPIFQLLPPLFLSDTPISLYHDICHAQDPRDGRVRAAHRPVSNSNRPGLRYSSEAPSIPRYHL
jgi:hypothetical protein